MELIDRKNENIPTIRIKNLTYLNVNLKVVIQHLLIKSNFLFNVKLNGTIYFYISTKLQRRINRNFFKQKKKLNLHQLKQMGFI